MSELEKIIVATNCQKILSFLVENPGQEYFDRQLSQLTGVSRAGTNFALRDLAGVGLVHKEKRGRMNFCRVSADNVLIKHIKITQTLVRIAQIVEQTKEFSLKIILYGSAARGENMSESDLDLFFLTRDPREVERFLGKRPSGEKIQGVIKNPLEMVRLKNNNPTFCRELEGGIVLWEAKPA